MDQPGRMGTRAAPPTTPGAVRAPSAWPGAVVALAIIAACLDVLRALQGVLVVVATTAFGHLMPNEMRDTIAKLAVFDPVWSVLSIAHSIGLALALVLLVRGTLRLGRRDSLGPRLLTRWALLRVCLGALDGALVWWLVHTQFGVMQEQLASSPGPSGVPPIVGTIGALAGPAVALLTLVWWSALPLLWLWWSRREKVRREIGRWDRRSDEVTG
jgi:hypothetical protein